MVLKKVKACVKAGKKIDTKLLRQVLTSKTEIANMELEKFSNISEKWDNNEAAQSIINYKKDSNSLQWELFDDAMDTLKRVNTESDYRSSFFFSCFIQSEALQVVPLPQL